MAFIPFPTLFVNATPEELEKQIDYGIDPQEEEGLIYLNPSLISSFTEMTNGNTMVWMSGGECYTLLLSIEVFIEMLRRSEIIVDLADMGEN